MPITDVLTDVLETVRVGAACYGRVEASAPWGIGVEADEALVPEAERSATPE